MPLGVGERGVDMAPGSGVVDQDHGGDGDATKNVERGESLRKWHSRLFDFTAMQILAAYVDIAEYGREKAKRH